MRKAEKLAAILAAIQTDPGNRGLARDPQENLFNAFPGDFEAACRSISENSKPELMIVTGFFIPTASPPAFETDGPLGAGFLARALVPFNASTVFVTNEKLQSMIETSDNSLPEEEISIPESESKKDLIYEKNGMKRTISHVIALERAGPGFDGRCRSMRGVDISAYTGDVEHLFPFSPQSERSYSSIGIGDGGNEIGMGKIPHETIVKNIPNGDLIHCRVPTDHLIVAGVSNWGAYALAAGVYVLRSIRPASELFDPDRERAILEEMVRKWPLVDGVTGKQTATVDGLTWDDYIRPMIRIREILEM